MFDSFKYKVDQTLNIWIPGRQEKVLKCMAQSFSESLFEIKNYISGENMSGRIRLSISDINATIKKIEDMEKECVARMEAEVKKAGQIINHEWISALSGLAAIEKYYKDRRDLQGKSVEDHVNAADTKAEINKKIDAALQKAYSVDENNKQQS